MFGAVVGSLVNGNFVYSLLVIMRTNSQKICQYDEVTASIGIISLLQRIDLVQNR